MMSKIRLIIGAMKAVAFASRHVPMTKGFQYLSIGLQANATTNNIITQAVAFSHAMPWHVQKKALRVPLGTNMRIHSRTMAAFMVLIVTK